MQTEKPKCFKDLQFLGWSSHLVSTRFADRTNYTVFRWHCVEKSALGNKALQCHGFVIHLTQKTRRREPSGYIEV